MTLNFILLSIFGNYFFLPILAQVTRPVFISNNCFMSLSDPDIMVTFSSNFLDTPDYFRAKTKLSLSPANVQSTDIEQSAEHHFVKVSSRSCRNSLTFSPRDIQYNFFQLSISLYLGFEDEPFADYFYEFNQDFIYNINILFDHTMRFGLSVNIQRYAESYVQMNSYYSRLRVLIMLKELHANHDGICVITPHDDGVAVKPSYTSGKLPFGYVTKITFEYPNTQGSLQKSSYSAFGCRFGTDSIANVYAVLDKNINRDQVTLRAFIQPYSESAEFIEDFTIPATPYHQLEGLNLPANSKRLILIAQRITYLSCPNTYTIFTYLCSDGTPYFAREEKNLNDIAGVTYRISLPKDQPYVCPA